MNKFLPRSLFLTLACLCSGLAAAEIIVPLSIGGTEIRVAADDGYLRTSEKLPAMHAVAAAALSPGNRLVESFVSEADAKRMLLGLPRRDTFLQVQVLRNAEALDFTEADWEQGRPQIAKALGVMDLNAILANQTSASGERMSAAAGMPVSLSFGELGKPMLYGLQGPSLRFVLLLPMSVEVGGQSHQVTLEGAGAVARLSNKLVYLFAYREHAEGSDTTAVRAALDRFVDRAIALNLDLPAVGTAPTAAESATAR